MGELLIKINLNLINKIYKSKLKGVKEILEKTLISKLYTSFTLLMNRDEFY